MVLRARGDSEVAYTKHEYKPTDTPELTGDGSLCGSAEPNDFSFFFKEKKEWAKEMRRTKSYIFLGMCMAYPHVASHLRI